MRITKPESPNRYGQISLLLRDLKKESGCKLYDDEFEQWCAEAWGIVWLHENEMYPLILTGLEMPDETWTLLVLKYNVKEDVVSA